MSNLAGQELVEALRKLQPNLTQAGITSLALFGSRSRGDHRDDSDIDLLIEVEAGRRFSLIDMSGVSLLIQDRIGVEANVHLRNGMRADIVAEIAPDIVEVFG
jgi:uncharacterized protein